MRHQDNSVSRVALWTTGAGAVFCIGWLLFSLGWDAVTGSRPESDRSSEEAHGPFVPQALPQRVADETLTEGLQSGASATLVLTARGLPPHAVLPVSGRLATGQHLFRSELHGRQSVEQQVPAHSHVVVYSNDSNWGTAISHRVNPEPSQRLDVEFDLSGNVMTRFSGLGATSELLQAGSEPVLTIMAPNGAGMVRKIGPLRCRPGSLGVLMVGAPRGSAISLEIESGIPLVEDTTGGSYTMADGGKHFLRLQSGFGLVRARRLGIAIPKFGIYTPERGGSLAQCEIAAVPTRAEPGDCLVVADPLGWGAVAIESLTPDRIVDVGLDYSWLSLEALVEGRLEEGLELLMIGPIRRGESNLFSAQDPRHRAQPLEAGRATFNRLVPGIYQFRLRREQAVSPVMHEMMLLRDGSSRIRIRGVGGRTVDLRILGLADVLGFFEPETVWLAGQQLSAPSSEARIRIWEGDFPKELECSLRLKYESGLGSSRTLRLPVDLVSDNGSVVTCALASGLRFVRVYAPVPEGASLSMRTLGWPRPGGESHVTRDGNGEFRWLLTADEDRVFEIWESRLLPHADSLGRRSQSKLIDVIVLSGTRESVRVRGEGRFIEFALDDDDISAALEVRVRGYWVEIGHLISGYAQRLWIPASARDVRLRYGESDCSRPVLLENGVTQVRFP